MNCRLVRLAASPHGFRGGRVEKGPATQVARSSIENRDEGRVSEAKPTQKLLVWRSPTNYLRQIGVPLGGVGGGHDAGCPAVDPALVSNQLANVPARTTRHRGVQGSPLGRGDQLRSGLSDGFQMTVNIHCCR